VVDNSSTNGDVEKVEEFDSLRVKAIKLGRHTSFSFANDIGARAARGLSFSTFIKRSAISTLVENV